MGEVAGPIEKTSPLPATTTLLLLDFWVEVPFRAEGSRRPRMLVARGKALSDRAPLCPRPSCSPRLQGCPTFWHLCAALEEELSWATH